MKNIKTCFLLIAVSINIFLSQKVFAQFLNDNVTGRPITKKSYTDIVGSPYLNDEWIAGTVKLKGGSTYQNVLLKYNIFEDELYFKGKDDEVLSFEQPVYEFTIGIKHYRNGYNIIKGADNTSYFEVIADGNTQCVKRTTITVSENKEFNSAITVKSFERNDRYYIYRSGKGVEIKRDKKSLLFALGDNQIKLENYIKESHLNFKKDEDLAKIIAYYNSI